MRHRHPAAAGWNQHEPSGTTGAEDRGSEAGWSLRQGADGATLALADADGAVLIRLRCATQGNRLMVNVPAFRPIGSEERLSFGNADQLLALVADPGGDRSLGGVTGTGAIPDELKPIVLKPMSASYGAQQSGPHPPPPERLAAPFLSACGEALTAGRVAESKPTPTTSPCRVQDGELLRLSQKALGTEPFWAATIDGRCVTYSTPDDQKGTRIWTRFGSGPAGGIWTGAFQGKPFVLRTEPAGPGGCSDGMSDRVYPLEARLTVAGEERRGCAHPL